MKISSKSGYQIIKILLYLGVIFQISRVFISLIFVNDNSHFSSFIIPIFIRVVLLFYFKKRINITSSLLWINVLMVIGYPILIYYNGINFYDIPLYFILIISLIIILVLSTTKIESELVLNDSLVKKTNRTIYWIFIISFVINNSLNKSIYKNKIITDSQSIVNQQTEVLDTIENSVVRQSIELPKMIDEITSFDSIKFYRSDNTISSYYTLKSMSVLELDMNKFKKIVINNITNEIKNDSNMMKMINDFDINYEFVYFDKEKSFLTRVESKNLKLN